MGCYFAVLVLVLVLDQSEKSKTMGELSVLGIHGTQKNLNVKNDIDSYLVMVYA